MAETAGTSSPSPSESEGPVPYRNHRPAVPGVGVEHVRVDRTAIEAVAATTLRVTSWRDGSLTEVRSVAGLRELVADPATRTWIDVSDPSEGLVAEIADALGLHPLIAEDIVERNQRSKVELTGDLIHLVVFSLALNREVEASEIDCVLTPSYLLTIHEAGWDPFATVHLRLGPGPLLLRGVDYLLWALMDALVDSYFPVFDALGDSIDQLEDDLVAKASPATLERLFDLKRGLTEIRHVIGPQRDIFNQLTNRELALVAPEQILYFRDLYDHLIRLTDELDTFRELVAGALDVYLSTINNNLSAIMKRLTGVTVILAGVGAVAGVFGMSEAGALLAGENTGFWAVTLAVSVAAGTTAFVLRRIDWI